jgi:hypothetical protein
LHRIAAGRTVTALEIAPDVLWDFVPYPGERTAAVRARHAKQRIVAECARIARTVIITEMMSPDLERIGGIVRLHPVRENGPCNMWWHSEPILTRLASPASAEDAVHRSQLSQRPYPRSAQHWFGPAHGGPVGGAGAGA